MTQVTQKWLYVLITHPNTPPKRGLEVFLRNLLLMIHSKSEELKHE